MTDPADIYERARHIILMVIEAQWYLDEGVHVGRINATEYERTERSDAARLDPHLHSRHTIVGGLAHPSGLRCYRGGTL